MVKKVFQINRKNMDYSVQMLMKQLINKLGGREIRSLPHTIQQINFRWLKKYICKKTKKQIEKIQVKIYIILEWGIPF